MQLGWRPRCFQLVDGCEGPGERDAIHDVGDLGCVGPVPKEATHFDGHGCCVLCA